ncbi:MAG TPA: GAF domain-containing sensor histidine kinase [Solirubrobacteraceae bacterium]|jgi:signal transduction histidine kinase|nr:GAF domain-containing sensor histidine kinase [Solirubrobacteraceae bacterium]
MDDDDGHRITDGLDSDRLRTLIDIGGFIVADLDLDSVLGRVLDAACELTGARYAALGVLDEAGTDLERFITQGLDPETEQAIGERPLGRGLLGVLIRDPKPLRVSSVDEDPASYGFPAGHPAMNTFLGVPVLVRGHVWGNLYLTEKQGAGQFDQADEDAAVVLARWTAIAIENARLYSIAEHRRGELERAVQGLQATQAIAHAVGADIDLDRVLELIVKRGRALVDARSVVILLRDGDELVLTASAGHSRRPHGERIAIDASTSGELMRHGRPERVSNVQDLLRMAPEQFGVDGAHSALLIPLAHRGEPLGVLIAFDREPTGASFSEEDEAALKAFGASAATAVGTARGVKRQRLRDALSAAEAERRRWAQELHDETLQGLGGLRILLSVARRDGRPTVLTKAVDQTILEIEREITNLGSIITELRPAALDSIGLAAALEALFDRHRTVNDLNIEARLAIPDRGQAGGTLDPQLEASVYRLVQESLTNVVKHARATRVEVSVTVGAGRVVAEIVDDGVGFALDHVSRGFGLTGMRERVVMAGGELTIDSSDAGTIVAATLPASADGTAKADQIPDGTL